MRSFLRGLLVLWALGVSWTPVFCVQVEDREQTLERIRGEIARLQAQLSQVQQRASSLTSEFDKTRLELEIQEQRVEESRAAQAVARQKVLDLEEKVEELEAALLKVRFDLRERLGALYRLGRGGYLRLILSLESGQEALPALRQLRYFARQDGKALNLFVDTKVRLEFEEKELATERARVEAWVTEEEQRKDQLTEIQVRRTRLLARLEKERESLQSEQTELSDKERKLSNFLAFLYGRNQGRQGGTPIQSFRGVLDWPIAGSVSIPFGPRVDPRYKTRTPHNGIELSTTRHAEVRSVFSGKVLFAAPFKGYGPTVILTHPEKVFTLYAGLDTLRVSVGDVISLEQVVGTASESLYFEIRVENSPEDPRLWLRE